MSPPIRVVLFTDSTTCGGAERSLAHLLAHLSPATTPVVVGIDRATVDFVSRGRPDVDCRVVEDATSKLDVIGILRLRRAIRAAAPDVVHVNLTGRRSCRFALAALLAPPRCRVVAVEQLPTPSATRWQRWWRRLAHDRLAAHVAVGDAAARSIEADLGVRAGAVRSIRNGIPDPGPPAAPHHTSTPGRTTVGTVARFDDQKGIDVLLRAVAPLDVDVRLVGDGPLRASIEALAADLGLAARVTMTGWTDDVRSELAHLDVFVLASRNEGFPLAVIEAMLAELPIVATDVGSVREAIHDGETGLLVPADDVESLRDAITRLAADPGLRTRLGRAARAAATQSFTAESMARDFDVLYRSLVTP